MVIFYLYSAINLFCQWTHSNKSNIQEFMKENIREVPKIATDKGGFQYMAIVQKALISNST